MTACVLLHRGGRWLFGVRADTVAYAPGQIGLIGGHLEADAVGPDALEVTARREAAEEAGLDLGGVRLDYLRSDLFDSGAEGLQLTAAFVAGLPAGPQPAVTSAELTAVGWWSPAELAADPRCPEWLPALVDQAVRSVDGQASPAV